MKILFLHLSDAHLRDNTDLREINIGAMINALKQMGEFDECVLIFSGDIADSGAKNAYKNAGKLVGRLVKNISNKYLRGKIVQTVFVPGNHDNVVKNKDRDNFDLEEYYKNKEHDCKFREDIRELSNFYDFANRNRCFRKERIIDVKRLKFDNFIIKVNMINSAPFSLLGSGNRDKGMHYIPIVEFEKLNRDLNQKYTISVIHHGPEWFSDISKQKLYDVFHESTDLLFVGHEHFSLNENKNVNGKHIDISSGIALYGTKTEHGFNAILLDTELHTLVGFKYVYNGRIYKPSKILQNDNVIFNNNFNFRFSANFQQELMVDSNEREGEKYMNYFVFPSLEAKNINSDMKNHTVNTVEKFKELFSLKTKISIEGSTRTGKSLLAKYLTNILSEDYVVLLLTEESFYPKNIHNVIKYALQNEFGEDADLDAFLQLETEKKVLIVDRNDKVDKGKWKEFFKSYSEHFGHIIFFCGLGWDLNIKERAIEELTDNAFYYMKICPFFYIKREELIKKVCSGYLAEYPTLNIEEKVKK